MVSYLICVGEHLTDDVVAAGGKPITTGFALVAEVVDHRPGIEDLSIAKTITVIPGAEFIVFVRRTVVGCHFPYFVRRKAEVFAVPVVENGVDLQVVQAAEDALLGNTEDAG